MWTLGKVIWPSNGSTKQLRQQHETAVRDIAKELSHYLLGTNTKCIHKHRTYWVPAQVCLGDPKTSDHD